jgi:hypothetical protein
MALPDALSWGMLLAAFAGGAFGASVGALQAFSLAGLVVVVGEVYALLYGTLGAGAVPVDLTGSIAFGVVLGPHVAFGGGAAAVAFAASRGHPDTDFEYHEAKHVTRGVGNRPVVLAVGGLFGVFGHVTATAATTLGPPTDPVALGVVASALVHRVAFGYDVVGASPGAWFDMSPFARDERRSPGGRASPDGGRNRLVVEPWLAYQYRWSDVVGLGAVAGVLGGYVAYVTASAFLAFGISVVALAFLCAGVERIPVTHHMSLPASTAVLASVDHGGTGTPSLVAASVPLGEALVLGATFGVAGAVAGELAQRVLYAHADTHLDPPAASIVVTTLLIGALAMVGVFPGSAWIPLP